MAKYRIWHIPQVPMKAFRVDVESPKDGKRILDILANYDIFQFENNVKPDYCIIGGLEVLDEDGDWVDWEDGTANNIDRTETFLGPYEEASQ